MLLPKPCDVANERHQLSIYINKIGVLLWRQTKQMIQIAPIISEASMIIGKSSSQIFR